MPSQDIRVNLSAAQFPLVTPFHGRSIIIPRYDQNFNRFVNSQADTDKDFGIPQIFYGHNIFPTSQGFQSIGFNSKIPPVPDEVDFDKAFPIRDENENVALFSPSGGKNYIYTENAGEWISTNPFPPGTIAANILVTYASVKKHTYIFYENLACYEYDFETMVLFPITLNGLSSPNIRGICTSNGYLIAFDDETVYWSSTTDPVDFIPSLSTGASSSAITDLKGRIVVVLPVSSGFIIYSNKNAVMATYSGNVRFPWIFREIPNSAGIEKPEKATFEAALPFHYAWTTSGIMKLERVGAEHVLGEISDFIAAQVFEDYNENTKVFSYEKLLTTLKNSIFFVANRYLILSYGKTDIYSHALIFDIVLKRLGKVKIDHVHCFTWPEPNFFGAKTYENLLNVTYEDLFETTYEDLFSQQVITSKIKKDIAFLASTGEVKLLDATLGQSTNEGVIVLGKYQLERNTGVTFLGVEIENIDLGVFPEVEILSSFTGKSFEQITQPYLAAKIDEVSKYMCKIKSLNHSVRIKGFFNLVSMIIKVMPSGSR